MKKLSTKQLLLIILIFDTLLCCALFYLNTNKQALPVDYQISQSSIQRICELATLDCYYHNVSEWSKKGNILGYGEKTIWIEYDGIVRAGVKADQIKISVPDKDNVVTVTIPEANILDKDLDEESMREINSEIAVLGFIYEGIKTEERKEALRQAQENMVVSASQNGMILGEARERAKNIIEKNIIALGEATGVKYKVKFVDPTPAETQTISETE